MGDDRIGPYRLEGRLGAGGMGEVFSAYDERLDRRVALKLVRPDLAGATSHERFRREARAAAGLSHPSRDNRSGTGWPTIRSPTRMRCAWGARSPKGSPRRMREASSTAT